MDHSIRHILLQLEILLKEYPEARFFIQDQIKTMITDLINAEEVLQQLEQ